MKQFNLMLFLFLLYSISLSSQSQYIRIKEEKVGDDTIVWESTKGASLINIYVKADHDSVHSCPRKSPAGMDIEYYNHRSQQFLQKSIISKIDSLAALFLDNFSEENLKELLKSSSGSPIVFFFRIKENGKIFSVDTNVREDVKGAINSNDYYHIQNNMKNKIVFEAPDNHGLIGCMTFFLPIKKNQIQTKLKALH